MARGILAALLLLGAYAVNAPGDARAADDYAGLYDYYQRRGAIYSTLDPEVSQAVTNLLRVVEPTLTLTVNTGQLADVQIIVVNARVMPNEAVKSVKRFEEVLDNVKGNMLALSGSIIVIDKDFISKLVLNAWLDSIQMGYGFDEAVKTGGSDIHNLEEVIANRYNPLGDYGRYRFLHRWRSGIVDPTYADDYSKVDVGLKSTLLTGAMAPILLHELGHLRQGTAGNFRDIISSIVEFIRTPRIRAAEDAADAYAAAKVASYLASLSKADYTTALIGALATVKLLRDELMEQAFSDFRGLQASDLFANVYSSDCQVPADYVPPADLYNRPIVAALNSLYGKDVEQFISPQSVLFASVVTAKSFPLLTKGEFDGLRDTMLTSQDATHAHRILRAQGIEQSVKKAWEMRPDSDKTRQKDADRVFAQFMGAPEDMLSALVEDDDRKLAPSAPGQHITATIDQFEQGLSALTFREAANCGSAACRIGTFKDSSAGFVELHSDASGITLIRAILPVKFNDTTSLGQQASGKYLEAMSTLLLIASGEKKPSDLATAQSLKSYVILNFFLTHLLQCGTFSGRVDDTVPVVEFRSVNPEGWIELRIQGTEVQK